MTELKIRNPPSKEQIEEYEKEIIAHARDESWAMEVNGIVLVVYGDMWRIENGEFIFNSGNGEGFYFKLKNIESLSFPAKNTWHNKI